MLPAPVGAPRSLPAGCGGTTQPAPPCTPTEATLLCSLCARGHTFSAECTIPAAEPFGAQLCQEAFPSPAHVITWGL